MSRILVVYFSLSGNTEKMAQYISEGIRFSGNEATMRKTSDTLESFPGDGYKTVHIILISKETINAPFLFTLPARRSGSRTHHWNSHRRTAKDSTHRFKISHVARCVERRRCQRSYSHIAHIVWPKP